MIQFIKIHITLLSIFTLVLASNSIITVYGTGTSSTSAHVTVTTDAFLCPDEFVVGNGASLTTWDPSAICAASISGEGDVSLQVILTFFGVHQNDDRTVLEWITESEVENLGFILERKIFVGSDWNLIADYINNPELRGRGNTSQRSLYRYEDCNFEAGVHYCYRLSSVDFTGFVEQVAEAELVTVEWIPKQLLLKPAYPNPYNSETVIEYHLDRPAEVELNIYDVCGRLVRELVQAQQDPGIYYSHFRDESLSGGIYFVRLRTGEQIRMVKMLCIK